MWDKNHLIRHLGHLTSSDKKDYEYIYCFYLLHEEPCNVDVANKPLLLLLLLLLLLVTKTQGEIFKK